MGGREAGEQGAGSRESGREVGGRREVWGREQVQCLCSSFVPPFSPFSDPQIPLTFGHMTPSTNSSSFRASQPMKSFCDQAAWRVPDLFPPCWSAAQHSPNHFKHFLGMIQMTFGQFKAGKHFTIGSCKAQGSSVGQHKTFTTQTDKQR